jgi:hypothetical protein
VAVSPKRGTSEGFPVRTPSRGLAATVPTREMS